MQLPYFYLNRHARLRLEEADDAYIVTFSDGIVSDGRTRTITVNGVPVKEGEDVLLPLDSRNTTFIAYSQNGRDGEWNVPDAAFTQADLFEITPDGNVPCGSVQITDGKVRLRVPADRAFVLRANDR